MQYKYKKEFFNSCLLELFSLNSYVLHLTFDIELIHIV